MGPIKNISREKEYRITFGFSLITSQIIFILLFNFWPQFESKDFNFDDYSAHDIDLDMIDITRQQVQRPPAPPSPQVPVPRPEDFIVDDMLDLEDMSNFAAPDFGELEMPEAEGDDSYPVHRNPQHSPNVRRIVEPVVPDEARQANIHAEITVTFLVNEKGEVEEVSISEIKLFGEDDEYEIVETIGYGIIETTLDAAWKWRFRPAEDDGENVRAITRHIFTYGV
ncbi:MAG: energy transducer TonB [Balneolales bacterium]